MSNSGIIIVISAPSGGGKGTILKELFKNNENLKYSISATTRSPRPGEEHGKQYYFISKAEFETLISENKMLEYASYNNNYYGTPKEPVEIETSKANDVILEIEVQGGAQIKKLHPECVSIFIVPPSMAILEKRLRDRKTEDEETILNRLAIARTEIPQAVNYDYVVVNDSVEDAVKDIEAIIVSEKLKYERHHNIQIFEDVK